MLSIQVTSWTIELILWAAVAAAPVAPEINPELSGLIEVVQEPFPETFCRLIGKKIPEFR